MRMLKGASGARKYRSSFKGPIEPEAGEPGVRTERSDAAVKKRTVAAE
jgi:hypothetical protein